MLTDLISKHRYLWRVGYVLIDWFCYWNVKRCHMWYKWPRFIPNREQAKLLYGFQVVLANSLSFTFSHENKFLYITPGKTQDFLTCVCTSARKSWIFLTYFITNEKKTLVGAGTNNKVCSSDVCVFTQFLHRQLAAVLFVPAIKSKYLNERKSGACSFNL